MDWNIVYGGASASHSCERWVDFSLGATDDCVLRDFVEEVAPDADVTVYGALGPLVMRDGVVPQVQPEIHRLHDSREAWVSRFQKSELTGRPYVLVLAERANRNEWTYEDHPKAV